MKKKSGIRDKLIEEMIPHYHAYNKAMHKLVGQVLNCMEKPKELPKQNYKWDIQKDNEDNRT